MAYEKHDWVCGEVLNEAKMNNIERGLADMDETYVPTEWKCGDTITAEKMNKIEDELAYLSENCGGGDYSTAEVRVDIWDRSLIYLPVLASSPDAMLVKQCNSSTRGTTEIVQLYKGQAVAASQIGVNSSVNITGDIQNIGLGQFLITGDGTITVTALT